MALRFTSTLPASNANYDRYLTSKPKKTVRQNDPALLDFSLAPVDASFVKLTRGSYISLDTDRYPFWFTGYVLNDPELEYLGTDAANAPKWGYKYQATSDEYVLSLKPLGFIQPFMNVAMGTIIKTLVEILEPGVFDTTDVEDGPIVAQFVIDPESKFSDVVRKFAESANYVFYGNNRNLYFKPQDDASIGGLTLDGNNAHFTPSRLTMRPSTSPIVNDVMVMGDLEPQTYMKEYFIGTGLDSLFPLVASVFGTDTSVLLDETFSSSGIDSRKWDVYDQVQYYLRVSNGYLNSIGGDNNGSYSVSLRSVNPIPLDSKIRFTQGEWDFISGKGIIAGLWTQAPNNAYTGCLYALKVNGTTVNPVVSGALDATQSVTVSTAKRYVIRTIVEFTKSNRFAQGYSYINQTGDVVDLGGTGEADTANWQTILTEVDPTNGEITNQFTFRNTSSLTGAQLFATYVPLASDDLHATVTGITVSIPVNAALETSTKVDLKNSSFELWDNPTTPNQWVNPTNSLKEEVFTNTGNCLKLQATLLTGGYIEQNVATTLQANTRYIVKFRAQKSVGAIVSQLSMRFNGTGIVSAGFQMPVSSLTSSFDSYTGYVLEGTGLSVIPSDCTFSISLSSGSTEAVWVDDVILMSEFDKKLIGPNEIDAMDGLAPYATILSSNVGSDTKSTYFGSAQYNPGQAQLAFFKDSVNRTTTTPPVNQVVRLSYRSAGAAIGRAISRESINTEAVSWSDSGNRTIIRRDLDPRPRTSLECEMAAAAVVSENSFTHYEGTYNQFSTYLTAEPMAGGIVNFSNLSSMAPSLQSEEINEVTTTLESIHPIDLFIHDISFGKPDKVRRLLAKVNRNPRAEFQRSTAANNPTPVDASSVGLSFAPDVVNPELLTWDADYLHLDLGQNLGSGLHFELRYTDAGWGVDDGKNLITRTTSRYVAVPWTDRGRVFFVKQVNAGNLIKYSEDQTQVSVYGGSTAVTISPQVDPFGRTAAVSIGTAATNGTVTGTFTAAGSTNHCWSLYLKGVAGKTVTMSQAATTVTHTLSGQWQRLSLPVSGVLSGAKTVTLKFNQSCAFQTTRWSVEQGTLVEQAYSKTTASLYGPVSRYPAGIHISFPVATVVASADGSDLDAIIPTY